MMKQYLKLTRMAGKILLDTQYRSKVLDLVKYHTSASGTALEEVAHEAVLRQFSGRKIYLIGGCELTYIKEHLERLEAITKHTFDEGAAATPVAECENPASSLWKFKPDILVLSNIQNARGLIQKIQFRTIEYSLEDQQRDIQRAAVEYRLAINKIQKTLSPKIFILSYPVKYRPTFGLHEYRSFKNNLSLIEFVRCYELKLYQLCKQQANTHLLDINLIFESAGKADGIRDSDADGIYEHFTKEGALVVVRNLDAQLQLLDKSLPRVKCAVFDLDNTLWNGVLREDGVSGVGLRQNYLNIMKMLAGRGVMLALCSKNDPEEVEHVASLLGKELFELITVKKINWKPKSQNLKEIAVHLNIGLDSLAFFDDSAFERNEVQANAPEVMVFPETQVLSCLDSAQFLPFGELSGDAISRVQKYKEQALRQEAETQLASGDQSYEDFLRKSGLMLSIRRPQEGELSRIVELLQRTNQLNATLKRTDHGDIMKYFQDQGNHLILSAFLEDNFGDYGMIGVGIVEKIKDAWRVLEIAFSCRAMGRKVEHALLLEILERAFRSGAANVSLEVTITSRNKQIIDTLDEVGFKRAEGLDSSENQLLENNMKQPPQTIDAFASWLTLAS